MSRNSAFSPKTFAVIGAGPSGCVLAAFLAKGSNEVVFCDIVEDLVKPAYDRGIIIGGCEEFKQQITSTCIDINSLADVDPDVIFVATKATALTSVASSISKIHREGMYVISWQNGIDTEKELSKVISKKWIMRAVVNYGCSLVAPAHCHMSFNHPPHYLQEMDPVSENIAKIIAKSMEDSGLDTKHTRNMESMIWHKAILNAAMNPVCAVTGLTMYEAMRDPFVFKTVDSLLRECISVSKANGIDMGNGFYKHAIDYMSNAGKHKPSMLMDIENNRPTEIDYINGKFEEYGKSAGVQTPYNSTLRRLVKGVELRFLKH